MTTHTPGPWKLEEGVGGKDVTARDGVVAGNVYKDEDARLIAAAPELLAALELMTGDRKSRPRRH